MKDNDKVESTVVTSDKNKFTARLDLRIIVTILLLVIAGMLALWRPWVAQTADNSRTISVTGTATITATPDKFVFNPSYDFQNADKDAALAALTAKQTAVVAGLKKLGVTDGQISADSSGYNSNYTFDDTTDTYSYTLDLTITLADKTLTQKVQDYLVTTSPTGSVSPDAEFSTAKQKQVDSQGRDEATKDARAKADQSAKNLGFTVGKVKSVTDDNATTGIIHPLLAQGSVAGAESAQSSLPVESGQNDQDYSVTVVYYLR